MPTEFSEIQAACEGLLYPSETDSPFTVSSLGHSASTALEALGLKSEEVEEVPFTEFFQDFAESDPSDQRIPHLQAVLSQTLQNLHIYRHGSVEVHLDLIGRTPSGEWITLQTLSVET